MTPITGLTPHGCFFITESGDERFARLMDIPHKFIVKFHPGLSHTEHDTLDEAIQRVKNEIIAQEKAGDIPK